jgi:hypothetical protein
MLNFHNFMIFALFNYLRMWHLLYKLINLFIKELGVMFACAKNINK